MSLIYAGTKESWPQRVTVIILLIVERSRQIDRIRDGGLHQCLDWRPNGRQSTFFNTPNSDFLEFMPLRSCSNGFKTLEASQPLLRVNTAKANLLYQTLNSSDFWLPHCRTEFASQMNAHFKIKEPELEPLFLKEAQAAGLHGLKGHRSVGGLRASIYNACPMSSVQGW